MATDGNVVAAGVYISNETSRFPDGLLMKIDKDGNVVWARSYGGNGTDIISGLKVLDDGSILAVGLTTSFNAGRGDMWLLKVDSIGNVIWERTYGTLEMDEGTDLEVASGGDIVVTGLSTSGGVPHGLVFRADKNGNLKWAKEYTTGSELTILKILPTKDGGGFHVLGYANLGNGTLGGALLMKLDGNGKIVWARDYYTNGGAVLGRDAAIDPSGNLWLTGMAVTGEGDNTTYYGVLLGVHEGNITAERVYSPRIVFKSLMFDQNGDLWVGGLFGINTSEGAPPLVGKLPPGNGKLPGCRYLSSLNIDTSTPDIAVSDVSMAASKPNGTSRNVIISTKKLRTQPSVLCTYREGEEKREVCGPALMVLLGLSAIPLSRRRS